MASVIERTRTTTTSEQEGLLLARYLLRASDVPRDALERFETGCEALFGAGSNAEDLAFCRFVTRRPWSLPYLDAALGILKPQTLLRKKLFLMLAVLEAMPQNVAAFTPRPAPIAVVIARLLALGISSGFKALAGVCLYPFARRSP